MPGATRDTCHCPVASLYKPQHITELSAKAFGSKEKVFALITEETLLSSDKTASVAMVYKSLQYLPVSPPPHNLTLTSASTVFSPKDDDWFSHFTTA